MLVLLRISIGWHFLYQGIWKLNNPHFSSEAFLRQAKGPLADYFHNMIPDYDGRERLNKETLTERWRGFQKQVVSSAAVAEEGKKETERILKLHVKGLEDYFADYGEDIETYFSELDRFKERKAATDTSSPIFQKERLWDKQKELEKKAAGWLAEIDARTLAYEQEIVDSLEPAEQKRLGLMESKTELDRIDQLITYSNIAIGVCLMLGLFTRFAAFAGALFLLSIVLSQPELPFIYPHAPPSAGRSFLVNKEFVEMIALGALATMPVGRWGGLDFFIHHILVRPLLGKGKD